MLRIKLKLFDNCKDIVNLADQKRKCQRSVSFEFPYPCFFKVELCEQLRYWYCYVPVIDHNSVEFLKITKRFEKFK